MTFSSTIDNRPHTVGDMHMVTGTFTNTGSTTGGDIALASMLSSIFSAGANGDAAGATDTEIDGTVVTTLTLVTAAGLDGKWWALGKR
jgi:hypothetical protein